jgi:hypothetical protein
LLRVLFFHEILTWQGGKSRGCRCSADGENGTELTI